MYRIAAAGAGTLDGSLSLLLCGPKARFVLHRRLVLLCFMVPVGLGALGALWVPNRATADAMLLVSTAQGAAAAGANQAWVAWDTASYVAGVLQPLRAYPTDDPAVVRVEATAASAQSALSVMSRVLSAAQAPRPFAPARLANDKPDGVAARPAAGEGDQAEDLRLAKDRIAGLLQRSDALQQQAEGAKAVSAAAARALATQPSTVQDAWQTEPTTPSESERALLLGLMLEREHLVSQYAADFPAIREVNRKIAILQATVAGDGRSRRLTVRDVRNPTAAALTERLALSRLAEEDAAAQARVVQGQLAEARAHRADLVRARDATNRPDQAAATPPEADTLGPDITLLGPPVTRSADWPLLSGILLLGIAVGSVLAGGAALFQRWTLRLLFPVDAIRLQGESPLRTVPHLVDELGGAAGPGLRVDAKLAGVLRR